MSLCDDNFSVELRMKGLGIELHIFNAERTSGADVSLAWKGIGL